MTNTGSNHNVGLKFCYQGDQVKRAKDFKYLRGESYRPTDLTCPECNQKVTVRLSPNGIKVDHFAHYPDSDCHLQKSGESALHLNAKGVLADTLNRFHHVALVYQCSSCRQWQPFLRIKDYDHVEPELKLGKRRPDVSCLSGDETVGAAEVWHTHAVDSAKQYDLNATRVPWFEIPARNVRPSVVKYTEAADIASIDAASAGILQPTTPTICQPCHRQRTIKERFRQDERRAYLSASIEERENWPTAKYDAVKRLWEEEERQKAEREAWEQRDGPARLDESNQLIIPVNSLYKYRYWPDGQPLVATLAELNAPLETWNKYVMRADDLQDSRHQQRCDGEVRRVGDILYCESCRYFSAIE